MTLHNTIPTDESAPLAKKQEPTSLKRLVAGAAVASFVLWAAAFAGRMSTILVSCGVASMAYGARRNILRPRRWSRTSTSTAAACRPCPTSGSRSCRRWRTRWSATTRGRWWVRSNYEDYVGCGASGSRLMPCSWNIFRMPSARHRLSRVSGWSSPKSRRELAYASS